MLCISGIRHFAGGIGGVSSGIVYVLWGKVLPARVWQCALRPQIAGAAVSARRHCCSLAALLLCNER